MLRTAITHGKSLAMQLADPSGLERIAIVQQIVDRITVSQTVVLITIDRQGLAESLRRGVAGGGDTIVTGKGSASFTVADDRDDREKQVIDESAVAPIVIERSISLRRHGKEQRLVLTSGAVDVKPDAAMIKALVRARVWFAMLKDRRVDSIADIGRRQGLARTIVSHHLPLAFLAPDITEAVIEGRQPIGLTIERLIAIANASPAWDRQRGLLSGGCLPPRLRTTD